MGKIAPKFPQLPAAETAIKYANDVISGVIISGTPVKLACKRFLEDLEHADERGFFFDEDAAQHAVNFFNLLHHVKGEFAKHKETSIFILSPWEVFIVANLFGWKDKETKYRRFREAYLELCKKNGKSLLASGIALYMFWADQEPGAEVYSGACTRDQAKIVFDTAFEMVRISPTLKSKIALNGTARNRTNMNVEETNSKFEPVASEKGPLDGKNVHCVVLDEMHEHPNSDVYDVMSKGTVNRTQPLTLITTTAGQNRETKCYELRTYGLKILTKQQPDDPNFFCLIYSIDDGDDPFAEKNWYKANPELGKGLLLSGVRADARKAKSDPSVLNEFLRKNLGRWTSQESALFGHGVWEACCSKAIVSITKDEEDKEIVNLREIGSTEALEMRQAALESLRGRTCYGGLDLSSGQFDLASFHLIFPPTPEDKIWRILGWFWVPEEFVSKRQKRDKVKYDVWVKQGFITATPGDACDQEAIRAQILKVRKDYSLKLMGYDTWGAQWIGPKLLADGIKIEKHPQDFEHMSAPTKQMIAFVLGRKIEHYGNPVLRWNVGNAKIYQDTNGNMKPDKGKSTDRIDGFVALIMALGQALVNLQAKAVVHSGEVILLENGPIVTKPSQPKPVMKESDIAPAADPQAFQKRLREIPAGPWLVVKYPDGGEVKMVRQTAALLVARGDVELLRVEQS